MNRGSQSFKDTERFKHDFGGEAILVLVRGRAHAHRAHRGPQPRAAARGLPGRQRPGQQEGPRQPAAGVPRDRRAEAGEGRVRARPRSSTRRSGQIQDQFAKQQQAPPPPGAAGRRGRAQALQAPRRPARRAGAPRAGRRRRRAGAVHQRDAAARAASTGSPASRRSTTRRSCRRSFSTGPRARPACPKSRFAYLFPSKNAALIQIRLRPDLSDAEQARAIDLIRQATGEKAFQPREGARYIVTGRAGGGGGPCRRRPALDLHPARRRARC